MASKADRKTLEQTFKDTIDSATVRLKKYKVDVEKFKGLVTEQTSRLQSLLQRLRDCIEKLKALRDSYNSYNQRIINVRQRISVLLAEARSEGGTKAGEECNEKIKGLIEKFGQLNAEIGDFDGDGAGLRKGLDDLAALIKELCDETEGILGTMGATQSSINDEVTGLESGVGAAAAASAASDEGGGDGSDGAGEAKAGASKEAASESVTEAAPEPQPEPAQEESGGEYARFLKQFKDEFKKIDGKRMRRAEARQQMLSWLNDSSRRREAYRFTSGGPGSSSRKGWFETEFNKLYPRSLRGGKKTRKRRGGWRDAEKNSPVRSLTMKVQPKKKSKKKKSTKKRKKLKIKKSKKNKKRR